MQVNIGGWVAVKRSNGEVRMGRIAGWADQIKYAGARTDQLVVETGRYKDRSGKQRVAMRRVNIFNSLWELNPRKRFGGGGAQGKMKLGQKVAKNAKAVQRMSELVSLNYLLSSDLPDYSQQWIKRGGDDVYANPFKNFNITNPDQVRALYTQFRGSSWNAPSSEAERIINRYLETVKLDKWFAFFIATHLIFVGKLTYLALSSSKLTSYKQSDVDEAIEQARKVFLRNPNDTFALFKALKLNQPEYEDLRRLFGLLPEDFINATALQNKIKTIDKSTIRILVKTLVH